MYFRHGDMLFLLSSDRKQSNASLDSMNSASGTSNITGDLGSVSISGSSMSSASSQSVVEDEVDQILYKEDGKIYRQRNEQLWVEMISFFMYLCEWSLRDSWDQLLNWLPLDH